MLPKITLMLALTTAVGGSGTPVVRVAQGLLSGLEEKSTKGRAFHSYYGVPFAKPPVGDLRLKDPVASEPWEGVLAGTEQPRPCLQVALMLPLMGIRVSVDQLTGSEDCLYLNVFTPAGRKPEERLPVMVWIHGGGYFSGAAVEYQPHVLMNHDIVLVVLQYRLGILGFLSTEDDVMPGNYGMKDQVMALRWVQENIHSFGGDAERVTIFGESAGGASTHLHIMSPKSAGLFKRAIMQSGSAISPWAVSRQHRGAAQHAGETLGCSDTSSSDVLLQCLQDADARQLVELSQDFFEWFLFPMRMGPRVDGDFLPDDPEVLLRDARHAHVDVLSGVTANEGAFFINALEANENTLRALQENFSASGPISIGLEPEDLDPVASSTKVFQYYLGDILIDVDHYEQLMKLFTDRHFSLGHDLTTLFHSRVANTYRYSLDHRAELTFSDLLSKERKTQWISHCDDLFYLFRGGPLLQLGREELQDLAREDDLALREVILSAWINFAATGNPTPDAALGFVWESVSEDNLHYLSLTPTPTMQLDRKKEMRQLFASLPTRQNKILFPDREDQGEESVVEEDREDKAQDDEDDLGMMEAEVPFSRQFSQDEL
ncbi:venom carboxylesterase-6-like [Penaeus indicus]|uniref:venom carboxylesterase-6-like n=1 Tax=Penaeus indicus TaxID=29960 RepID=UPI00300D85EA